MNKLIKHEFRATSRMILPFLAVAVASALAVAAMNSNPNIPGPVFIILTMICFTSMMALGFLGLIIIVSRFYRNTMTDTGYLTMTLPLSSHQFIWGELIMCLLWFIIVAAVLFVTFIASLAIMEMLSLPEIFKDIGKGFSMLGDSLEKNGISGFTAAVIILEGILAVVLGFFEFCLRVYACMSVGQIFSRHRTLWSVIAYILIGIVLVFIFFGLLNLTGSAANFDGETLSKAAAALGIFDLILLVIDAVLYLPTSYLIGKKLNLA